MLAQIVSAFVVVIIGITLFPIMNTQINEAINNSNLSLSEQPTYFQTMLNLTPYLFAFAILMVAFVTVLNAFREGGLIESGEWEDDYKESKTVDNRRQTYEEYVRERLRVERMMRWGSFGFLRYFV